MAAKAREWQLRDHLSENQRSAILSHTWGTTKPDDEQYATLTTQNVEAMLRNIDFDRLAKTFQDAIIIIRALHLCYVRIDALCIIQDSPKDWASERSNLAQHQSGSEICIPATASGTPHHGILHPRAVGRTPITLLGEAEGLAVQPSEGM